MPNNFLQKNGESGFDFQVFKSNRPHFFLKKVSTVSAFNSFKPYSTHIFFSKKMVSPVRLELTTPCLKGRCSNQLSYGPNAFIIRFYLIFASTMKKRPVFGGPLGWRNSLID